MQNTLFEFGVSTGENNDDRLSSVDSLGPQSSDVVGNSITDSQSSAETPASNCNMSWDMLQASAH